MITKGSDGIVLHIQKLRKNIIVGSDSSSDDDDDSSAQVDVAMDLDRKFEDVATSSILSLGKTKRESPCHKDKDYSQAKKRSTVQPSQSTAIAAAVITPIERKYHGKEHSSLLDMVKSLVRQACALEGGLTLSLLKTQYGQIVCENNTSAVVAVLRLVAKLHQGVEDLREVHGREVVIHFSQHHHWTRLAAVLFLFPEDVASMTSNAMSMLIPGCGIHSSNPLYMLTRKSAGLHSKKIQFSISASKKGGFQFAQVDLYKFMFKK